MSEVGNLGCRDERVKLGVDGSGNVLAVDGNRLPLLEYFPKTFGQGLGGLTDHLPAEDVAHRILDDLAFFFTVIAVQLAEILEA